MAVLRLTKEFSFEMAHALWNYDGSCRNVHGHSYKLFVTVKGKLISDPKSAKNGMVIDFEDINQKIKEKIIDELDHCLMLSSDADIESLSKGRQMFGKMKIVDFQPTCENILLYMSDIIKKNLPGHIKLYSLKLYETSTSYAEWFEHDQL